MDQLALKMDLALPKIFFIADLHSTSIKNNTTIAINYHYKCFYFENEIDDG